MYKIAYRMWQAVITKSAQVIINGDHCRSVSKGMKYMNGSPDAFYVTGVFDYSRRSGIDWSFCRCVSVRCQVVAAPRDRNVSFRKAPRELPWNI